MSRPPYDPDPLTVESDPRIPDAWESVRDRWTGRRRAGCSVFVVVVLLGASLISGTVAARPETAPVYQFGAVPEVPRHLTPPSPAVAPRVQPSGSAESVLATPRGDISTALLGGWISWAEPDLGPDYLATRFPVGTLVRICAVQCLFRTSTDFGPSAAIDPPRIADLAVLDWEQLCGLPRDRGLCRGTVEALGPSPTLPATDMEDRGG